MARPIAGKKKDHDIRVRVDEDLYYALFRYCKKSEITRAEGIRKAIGLYLEKEKNPSTGK